RLLLLGCEVLGLLLTVGVGHWRLVLWQTQYPLANDAALDLAGAARDGVLPRAQHAVVPAPAVRHLLARPVQERVRAEQLAREVGDAHAQLGAEELQDGALGPRRPAGGRG